MSPSQRFAMHLEAVAYLQFVTVSGLSIADSQIYAALVAGVVWFAIIFYAYRVRVTDRRRERNAEER